MTTMMKENPEPCRVRPTTHTQPLYSSTKPTTHWIHDIFSPVFEALDHLKAAILDLSDSLAAASPTSTPNTLEPPQKTTLNQHPKQQHTQLQYHRLSKPRPYLYPPLPTSHPSHPCINLPVNPRFFVFVVVVVVGCDTNADAVFLDAAGLIVVFLHFPHCLLR